MKPAFVIVAYVLIGLASLGHAWHHECNIRYSFKPEMRDPMSGICTVMAGGLWPVFWSIYGAVRIMDPNRPLMRIRIE